MPDASTVALITAVTAVVTTGLSPVVTALINQHTAAKARRDEARVKIAVEARLRLLERNLTDAGEMRQRLRAVVAALHHFALEAFMHGNAPATEAALRTYQKAIRATTTAGPYVPPDLLAGADAIIQELQDIAANLARTASLATREARSAAQVPMNDRLRALAVRGRDLFGAFQRDLLRQHEEVLYETASGTAASAPPTAATAATVAGVRVAVAPSAPAPSGTTSGDVAVHDQAPTIITKSTA